jgi:uncharacterized protein (DUF4415 family)
MNKPTQTDWARIDALKDEDIDYSEIPDLAEDETFWSRGEVVVPLTIWLEPDVLAWFKALGKEYEARISAALREYKGTHGK